MLDIFCAKSIMPGMANSQERRPIIMSKNRQFMQSLQTCFKRGMLLLALANTGYPASYELIKELESELY